MMLGSFCSSLVTLNPKSLRIKGIQKGFIQYFEIYQSIQTEKDLNEISYIFPTDNNLCIYNMEFQVGDEIIQAELQSSKHAEETYQEAKKQQRLLAMTKYTEIGISSIKIGNIPKNKVVSVILQCAFSSILQNPTTILTKIPLQAIEPDGSYAYLYNLSSLDISVDFSISHLEQISTVYTNCESKYEKIDDYNGKLNIESAIFTDENILIMTEFLNPVQSQMIQTNKATLISLIPNFESKKVSTKEYVFLIDCSASMLGESIRKAKESLHLFLSKIPEKSYFNIIRFGSKYEKLFSESSEKVDSTIKSATEFIDNIRPNLGGTEMLSMLDELFKCEVKSSSQRQIFLITDGEVYERQKVVEKIRENRQLNRIFAIGLGHGADAGFLNEIAEITHGKSDFVFNKNELPEKVEEDVELSLCDSATGGEIHIEGIDLFECVPYPIPPLLPGVVSHFYVRTDKPPEHAMVSAKVGDDDVEFMVNLKGELQLLEKEKSPIFALFAQQQLKMIQDDEKKSVDLSLASGVMSKYTSYIAVSTNSFDNLKVESDEETMLDVIDLKEIYSGMNKEMLKAMMKSYTESSGTILSNNWSDVDDEKEQHKSMNIEKEKEFINTNDGPVEDDTISNIQKQEFETDSLIVKSPWGDEPSMLDIIRLQSRDGFWDFSMSFISTKLKGKIPDAQEIDLSGSPIVKKRILSSLFTLAYLSKFMGEIAVKWRFAKEKAIKWLKKIDSSVNWEHLISEMISIIIQ